MSSQWFQTTSPEVFDGLFEDLVLASSEEEHIAMLFNFLQNCLSIAAHGAGTGQGVLQRDGVVGAVTLLCFLREHLRSDSSNPANGVLRRFYKAAHRQIITAHRNESASRFQEIRASISKVIQKPYSTSFFHNCLQETRMSHKELVRLMLSPSVRSSICRIDKPVGVFAGERDGDRSRSE